MPEHSKAPRATRRRWFAAAVAAVAALVVAVLAAALVAGSEDGGGRPSPMPVARAYLRAWEAGDLATMAELVREPHDDLATRHAAVAEALGVRSIQLEPGRVVVTGDRAEVAFTAHLDLAGLGPWTYDGRLPLVYGVVPAGAGDDGGGGTAGDRATGGRGERSAWRIRWTPSVIHPALSEGRSLARSTVVPVRAPILGARDAVLDGAPGLPALRSLVGRVGEATAEQLAVDDSLVPGATLGRSGLEAAYQDRLAGRPAGVVRVVDDATGAEVSVLHRFAGEAPQPLRTTIDLEVQADAEAALAGLEANAALVAVRATGDVLAIANTPAGGFDRALLGTYPPGSTFKIVSAAALLRNGLTPSSELTCPPILSVGGRSFTNFEGESAGTLSFSEAFARSCNTAFLGAAEDLPPEALVQAAATFGFGAVPSLGVPVAASSFPEPSGPVERAAAVIGQGRVLVTPLHLATIAAAVRSGAWHPPVLLPEVAPADPAAVQPMEPEVAEALRSLMAGVVQRGTGTAAAPAEIGKTGTAEYAGGSPPPTHALFVGCRGDVCMSVVVEGGESGGHVAAPIAGRFFAAR